MKCPYCGSPVKDDAKFCTSCGARMEHQPAPEAPQTPTYYQQPYSESTSAQRQIKAVGFIDAIKLFFIRYVDFGGRSTRSEYWFAYLFTGLVSGLLTSLIPDLAWIWSVATLIPNIAISIRRMHDAGKSGWYLLMSLIPLVGWIFVLVKLCTASVEDNQWGPFPAE